MGLTPRAAMWIVVIFAEMMTVLIVNGLRFPLLRLPLVLVLVGFWFGTFLTLRVQRRTPASAIAAMRAYIMPAAVAGGLCGYLAYLAGAGLIR